MAINCDNCQADLEDFLYGELSESRSTEIRSHLSGCESCAALRTELERENEVFADFFEQTAIDPSEELWQSIRTRIGNEPVTQKNPGWLGRLFNGEVLALFLSPAVFRQVAFAVILIALTVTATVVYMKRNASQTQMVAQNHIEQAKTPQSTVVPVVKESGNPAEPATGQIDQPPEQRPMVIPAVNRPAPPVVEVSERDLISRQIRRAENEYRGAIRMLDRAIARRSDTFDPELIRQYQSSLALIDDSISQSRLALRRTPDDAAAGQFLLAAYARKVELMQDIAMR
ncbi:MAG: zf-HC2 domain-containing protein [Acidobacteria bacterium]|nr:zf-HC2 domain-containing protein [Acidobacteriota bacterium]